MIDRANTTATTWLGLTMGCARCHDHKYDPDSNRSDFYRFCSFFNTIPEKGLDGRTGNAEPVLQLPTYSERSRNSTRSQARLKVLKENSTQNRWTPWPASLGFHSA